MRLRRYVRRKGSYLNAVFSLFNEFDRQTKKTRKGEGSYVTRKGEGEGANLCYQDHFLRLTE